MDALRLFTPPVILYRHPCRHEPASVPTAASESARPVRL